MSHPIHPAVVHFPIACWTLATVCDIALFGLPRPLEANISRFAGALIGIGVVIGLVAMLTGLLELTKVERGSPSLKIVNYHMLIMMVSWGLYATSLFLRLDGTVLIKPGIIATGFSVVGFVCLSFGGYLGARLVYHYKVGVQKHNH